MWAAQSAVLLLLLSATPVLPTSYNTPCNYYKPYTYGNLNEACKNCNCDVVGSHSLHCKGTLGECYCRVGHTSRRCDKCDAGFWRSTGQLCTACGCSRFGSVSDVCSSTGQCDCLSGYTGPDCSACQTGFIHNSSGHCSECDSCTGRMLDSLTQSSSQLTRISTVSQDFFISKTNHKLKSLKKKSNRIMVKMREKIALLVDYEESVKKTRQVLFSSTKRDVSLPRQADKLVLKSIKSSNKLKTVATGLDSGVSLKNKYFREAYYQYDYVKYKLPAKLADLDVTRSQLRALSREVKSLNEASIGEQLAANKVSRDKNSALVLQCEDTLNRAVDFRQQGRVKSGSIETLTSRVRHLSTSLAEVTMDDIGTSLLPDTQNRLDDLGYVVNKFVGWKRELENKVVALVKDIESSMNDDHVQNVSKLIKDVYFLRTTALELPTTITVPQPLNANCANTAKLVRSMYDVFTLSPQPIADIQHVKGIIANIETITSFQNLSSKYKDSSKLRRKIKSLKVKVRHNVPRLENEMNVCNHRLKKLLHENRSDRNRLANIQTNLAYLSNSRKPPIKPEEDNMNLIEEYISNLTMKKRKFRSLGKNIESSMERMQRKIKDIKHKVLTFESIRFERNDWSRYTLPDNVKNISLSFRSDMKGGSLLSIGPQDTTEDLFVFVSRGTLSVTCYQPTSLTLFSMCPDKFNSPLCFNKLRTMSYTEYFDPRATFDRFKFASLHINIEYGKVTIRGYQDNKKFFSETIPCLISPHSLLLTKAPSKSSLVTERGFSGCITQLKVDGAPHAIRQAEHIEGHLERCQQKYNVEKSVVDEECGIGFFSLSSQTLIQPSNELSFEVVLGHVEKRSVILSAGNLKISAARGNVKGVCHGISIAFAEVFEAGKLFGMTLDVFETYISLKLSNENGSITRKLPCVLKPDSVNFIIGTENASNGCIKKL